MNKVLDLVEVLKADVNEENSEIVTFFEKILNKLFLSLLLLGIPVFILLLVS
ncbi:MAG TPA: hypothetical protein VNR61_18230 [Niallia sp.]|nr:hypothetical protein [Niallia sp.]